MWRRYKRAFRAQRRLYILPRRTMWSLYTGHWWVHGLLHLVHRGGTWACCGPAQSLPHCTKCNSPCTQQWPVQYQSPCCCITVRCSVVLMCPWRVNNCFATLQHYEETSQWWANLNRDWNLPIIKEMIAAIEIIKLRLLSPRSFQRRQVGIKYVSK